MAYAVQADIDALVARYAPSTTTLPTVVQSTLIIDNVSDEIDATLGGAGYTVPVVSPAYFVDYLSFLNALGAGALIVRSMFPDSTEGAAVGVYQFLYDWYTRALKALADGTGVPADVPMSASNVANVGPSTYLTRNPDTEEKLGDIAEPLFKIGTVF